MKAGLKISVIDANEGSEDGFLEVTLTASNGSCANSQWCFVKRDALKDFSIQLKDFPSNIKSRIKLETGGPEKPWATYLMFEVFCYEPTGKSAIKVIMETHFIEPHYDRSEFFIIGYPASLNRLGETLYAWNPLEGSVFKWLVDENQNND